MPVAMLALVVVLPTPPLPEVTTTTLDTDGASFMRLPDVQLPEFH